MIHSRLVASIAIALLAVGVSGSALAETYPVTGLVTLNADSGPLPDGSNFVSSGYDLQVGELAPGQFHFPPDTISVPYGPFTLNVTYQLVQLNQSGAMVLPDGSAMFDPVTLQIDVIAADISGGAVDLGTCSLGPIHLNELVGHGTSVELSTTDPQFVVPPVAPSDCGGYGDQINDGMAGSDNAITLKLQGNFTPPPDLDLIFADGFELP